MAEDNGAAGAGAGDAGAAGAGAGNAGAGAGAGAGSGAGAGAGAGSGAAPAWFESSVADTEARAWLQNKSFADHPAQVASHRALEKLVGGDPKTLIRIAKPGDVEGERAMRLSLGMPDAAAKYNFGDAEKAPGVNPEYVSAAREFFHKAGLSNDQAKSIVEANNAWVAQQHERQTADYNAGVAAGEQQLQQEWRGGYDRMINQAGMTAKMLGISSEMIDGMESKIGYADTLKFLANLGTKLGEDSFASADGGGKRFGGAMTPDEAKVQWDEMKMDKNYLAALMDNQNPGHKSAKEKQTNLFNLMYPAG